MGNIRRTLSYLKRNGPLKTIRMSIQRMREDMAEKDYDRERAEDAVSGSELKTQEEHEFKNAPFMSVVIPAYETKEEYLRFLLDSLLVQSYQNFEIILADAGKSDGVSQVCAGYADDRLVYIKLEENLGIAGNTNAAIEHAKGDVLVFADHDDFLEPDALFHLALAFEDGAALVYTDEDKYEEVPGEGKGRYFRPNRKPDFNYDLLLSNNYISHLTGIKTSLVKQAGGLVKEYDGAQDYDLILRCVHLILSENGFYEGRVSEAQSVIRHVPRVLYHWRVHELSTSDNPDSKAYAYEAGRMAVAAHLKARGIKGRVNHTEHLGFYAIEYDGHKKSSDLSYHIPKDALLAEGDFRNITEGIFKRKEVRCVAYKVTDRNGVVTEGPYRGMKWWDSGVMHRAVMNQDIPEDEFSVYCVRRGMKEGLTVYVPGVIFRL